MDNQRSAETYKIIDLCHCCGTPTRSSELQLFDGHCAACWAQPAGGCRDDHDHDWNQEPGMQVSDN